MTLPPNRFLSSRVTRAVAFVAAIVSSTGAAGQPGRDVPGGKDYPLITRYEGSVIDYYNVKQYDEVVLPLGSVGRKPAEGGKQPLGWGTPAKTQELAGKVTRIHYRGPVERSVLEVFANYQLALKNAAGFEILFQCAEQQCGPGFRSWLCQHTSCGQLAALGTRLHYIAGRVSRSTGEVYVSLLVEQLPSSTFTILDIIEPKPLELGKVTVDASAMAKDIAATGHIALYGILFDTNSADIKSDSDTTLKEIGTLLKQDQKLKLYVVGHTDNVGGYESNIQLSQRRAEAVMKALSAKYGVDPARLRSAGVGLLAPVAPNDAEDGRAKNRRVELVRQ